MSLSTKLYAEGLAKFRDNIEPRIRNDRDRAVLEDFISQRASPKEAREAGRILKQRADEKYGAKKDGNIEIIPAAWISHVLGNIDRVIDVGNWMMEGAPETVGMAWFGMKLILQAIGSNFKVYTLFGQGISDISEIMIIIPHYDKLYDERAKSDWQPDDMLDKLFGDIRTTYAAVLEFYFSVLRHIDGSTLDKFRHAFKDFFGAEEMKLKGKLDAIAASKKEVVETSQAVFQKGVLQQFSQLDTTLNAIDNNIKAIVDFESKARELLEEQQIMLRNYLDSFGNKLDEYKASVKPKTLWDLAKEEFEKNKSKLNIDTDTAKSLYGLLQQQHEGTCSWLLKETDFTSWIQSSKSDMLGISGDIDVGKSTVIAFTYKNLSNESSDDDTVVRYISSPPGLRSLRDTMIWRLYELAVVDENKLTLLEDCNKVFDNRKQQKLNKMQNIRDEEPMDLADTLDKLADILKRKVIFFVDAIDRLSMEDQKELYQGFHTLINRSRSGKTSPIHIILGFRSGCEFQTHFTSKYTVHDANLWCQSDIEKLLDDELNKLPGWAAEEVQEAKQSIIQKAGPNFKYVKEIAIPFVQEPFVRPLSKRLEDLPEGINETYNQAIQMMSSNYLGLLRTALPLVLLCIGAPTVRVIMDAFTGTYTSASRTDTEKTTAEVRTSYSPKASELEVRQVERAGGPFLEIYGSEDDQIVICKDYSHVRDYCFKSPNQKIHDDNEPVLCDRCKGFLGRAAKLTMSECDEQLTLALMCVKHMNNQVFQQRFGLREDLDSSHDFSKKPHSGTTNSDEEFQSVPDAGVQGASAQIPPSGKVTMIGREEPPGLMGDSNESQTQTTETAENEGVDDDNISEDSIDEDQDEGQWYERDEPIRNPESASSALIFRYEPEYWHEHVKEAEKLLTAEDRCTNSKWAELITELDKFSESDAFGLWQKNFFRRICSWWDESPAPWKPLHVAAYLGLTAWTEHLISNGAEVKEKCDGRNPLQAAALSADNITMLEVLLKHGVDPNEETETTMPAFHLWMSVDPSYEAVSLFLKYGSNPTMIDHVNGWNVLHYLASSGDDPKVLELLLNSTFEGRQPVINTPDKDGYTPIHILLDRGVSNYDLLKAFVEVNANVNAEDVNSKRPLQFAAALGDTEILNIILPKVSDVNDPDTDKATAMHMAAGAGYPECVKLLLHNEYCQAEPNLCDDRDQTPFFRACQGGSDETAKYLLDTLREKQFSIFEIIK